jgi:hypothetical protein
LDETHPEDGSRVRSMVQNLTAAFEQESGFTPADHIVICRDRLASKVVAACLIKSKKAWSPFPKRLTGWC